MRRFIIYGAGAVGGSIGAELARAGIEVVLVARGAQRAALERDGLHYVTPDGDDVLRLPVAGHASEIEFRDDDVVIIATKTQDTVAVLDALEGHAPDHTPIVCAQNGVANEDFALRKFAFVYGMAAVIWSAFLRPGEVACYGTPHRGVLHLGRYPKGPDLVADEIGALLGDSQFLVVLHDDIRPVKFTKLLGNLGNAATALLERSAVAEVADRARVEGRAVYAAASIDYLDEAEFRRQNAVLTLAEVPGYDRTHGSTWQSLSRGAEGIETDYLSGEIVLLGRRHGVPTPVNALLQRLTNAAAREGRPPGSMSLEEFDRALTATDLPGS